MKEEREGGRDKKNSRKNPALRNSVHDGLNRDKLKQISLLSKLPTFLEIYSLSLVLFPIYAGCGRKTVPE